MIYLKFLKEKYDKDDHKKKYEKGKTYGFNLKRANEIIQATRDVEIVEEPKKNKEGE